MLPKTDAIIFTGGMRKMDSFVQQKVCERLAHLGIELDFELNKQRISGERMINHANSKVKVLVIPTDEELEIARITEDLIGKN